MGRVDTSDNLNDLLKLVADGKQFVLLAEDWVQGLLVEQNATGAKVKEHVEQMRKNHGDNFAFRAFNDEVDLHWNGELGTAVYADGCESEVTLPLISDEQQYPAAGKLKGRRIVARQGADGHLRFVRMETMQTEEV